MMSYSI